MSILNLLSPEEQAKFEQPPLFTKAKRQTFFTLSDDVTLAIRRLQNTTNKICFFVQWAYFKACQQFFNPDDFIFDDMLFAAHVLELDIRDVDINSYRQSRTSLNHQQRITELLGYHVYNDDIKKKLSEEIKNYVKKQVPPKKIFLLLLKNLQQRRIVFPTYHALSKLIGVQHRNNRKAIQVWWTPLVGQLTG